MNLSGVIQLHASGHLDAAEQGYRSLIAQRLNSDVELRNLGLICMNDGRLSESIELLQVAAQVNPSNVEILHDLGLAYWLGKDAERALSSWRQCLALNPQFAQAHMLMGVAFGELGQLDLAIDSYQKALAVRPDFPEVCYNLGNLFVSQGNRGEGISYLRRAIELKPDYLDAYLNLGNALSDNTPEVIACLQKALQICPEFAAAHLNLGNAYSAVGRLGDAFTGLTRALEIRPDFPEAHNSMGLVLRAQGKLREALESFCRAVELKPDFCQAYVNRGLVLKDMGMLEEGIASIEKALQLRPGHDADYFYLGILLSAYGNLDQAMSAYHQWFAMKCERVSAAHWVRQLGEHLLELERIPIIYKDAAEIERCRQQFTECLSQALNLVETNHETLSVEEYAIIKEILFRITNFYLAYQQYNDRELQVSYCKLAISILMPQLKPYLGLVKATSNGKRIRVGLASEYLRNHNGSSWAYGWLANLPADDYQFFFYSLNGVTDQCTERFAALGTYRWLPFGSINYEIALSAIKDDDLDVLILPDVGMTASSRILSLARLAPIQCVGWGHPVTTGSPNIDYYLSGDLMETAESDDCYSERLIRLPNLGLFLDQPEFLAEDCSRAEFGLPDGKLLYGAVQSLFKYLPQFDCVYPAIAKLAPEALFIFVAHESALVTAEFESRLKACFEQFGLSYSNHVKVLPRMSLASFMRLLRVLDVALDSVGFNGGTTAMRSLHLDCPVVALAGPTMRERAGSAMLEMIGLDETITKSLDDYVSIAAKLGTDRRFRSAVIEKIAANKHKLFEDKCCTDYLDRFLKEEVARVRAAASSEPPTESIDYYNLALEYHRNGQVDEAVVNYRKALQFSPSSPQIHNDLAVALCRQNLPEEAKQSLARALELRPGYPEAHLNLGVIYSSMGDFNAAAEQYQLALSSNPAYGEAYYNLGITRSAQRNFAEAEACYRNAIARRPEHLDSYLNLGNVLQEQGQVEEAVGYYQQAIGINPAYPRLYLSLGVALCTLGRYEESISCCQKLIELVPDSPEAYNNLGRVLAAQGKWDDSIVALKRAIELKPDFSDAHSNLGISLQGAQRLEEAVEAYELAIELSPSCAQKYNNLGAALQRQKRLDEAVVAFRRAIELQPDSVETHNNLGIVYQEMDKQEEAISSYRKAVQVGAGKLQASSAAARAGELLCEIQRIPVIYSSEDEILECRENFSTCLREAVQLVVGSRQSLSAQDRSILRKLVFKVNNFYLAYQQQNDKDLQIAYSTLATEILKPEIGRYQEVSRPAGSGGKIRVGIASENLMSHNGAYWAYDWLRNLPASDYEFFLYSLSGNTDWFTAKFAELGTYRWLPFQQDSYLGSLEKVQQDQLDVLLLPDVGMTASSRVISLARLAPIQCVGWGHPVTTGSAAIDYYLSSDLMESKSADDHYSEKLIRLPNLGLYFENPKLPGAVVGRDQFGIPSGRTVFGGVQSLFKYLPQFDFIYPEIAKQVPDSLFVFVGSNSSYVTAKFANRLERIFNQAGVDFGKHVMILPRMSLDRFFDLLTVLDVNLDSVGWNGGITTMRSIAVDLPLVTIPGEFMRGRHSCAMLEMIGMPELIVNSADQYISLASKLGTDKDLRASVVAKLNSQKQALFEDKACIEFLDHFWKSEVEKSGRRGS